MTAWDGWGVLAETFGRLSERCCRCGRWREKTETVTVANPFWPTPVCRGCVTPDDVVLADRPLNNAEAAAMQDGCDAVNRQRPGQ